MTLLRSSLAAAAAGALALAARLSARRAGLVLVYHALAERGGDPGHELVPPHGLALFEAQLRHLRARYRLVPAKDILAAAAARRRGQRFPVAITFDDDLASHVRLAGPVLQRAGAPATFFLCGASLERPFSFWWERLQRAVDRGLDPPLEGTGVHQLAERIEAMGPQERDAVATQLAAELGPDPEDAGLRASDVRALVAAGFDVGFHTLRHDRLVTLPDDDLARAMTEGRAALEATLGRPLSLIAYPHGKADHRVARAARNAGFQLGFTGVPEPVVPGGDPLLFGRVVPAHGSVGALAVQLVRTLLGRRHR